MSLEAWRTLLLDLRSVQTMITDQSGDSKEAPENLYEAVFHFAQRWRSLGRANESVSSDQLCLLATAKLKIRHGGSDRIWVTCDAYCAACCSDCAAAGDAQQIQAARFRRLVPCLQSFCICCLQFVHSCHSNKRDTFQLEWNTETVESRLSCADFWRILFHLVLAPGTPELTQQVGRWLTELAVTTLSAQ